MSYLVTIDFESVLIVVCSILIFIFAVTVTCTIGEHLGDYYKSSKCEKAIKENKQYKEKYGDLKEEGDL